MIVKDIIKIACLFLGKENFENLTELGGNETSTDSQKKELALLLKCLNLTYSEIASDYVPLLCCENIQTENGKIMFCDLTKNFCELKSLKDENGYRLKYKLFPDYILTDASKVEITYSYLPTALTSYESLVENFSKKVSEKILAFGLAMEYCFISGLYDDAEMWEKRFKDALFIKNNKKTEIKLPRRRWN